ncbi:hypothetical protein Syun_012449 [Stephania yunnanensis]|uniref:Uncharacterized protein n=1 Tax=Stephania yunnanensis TaxID=152371 RepID=A0AAP0PHI4_9MAGN
MRERDFAESCGRSPFFGASRSKHARISRCPKPSPTTSGALYGGTCGGIYSGACGGIYLSTSKIKLIIGCILIAREISLLFFVNEDAKGTDVDLSTYKEKSLLIVNVASQRLPQFTGKTIWSFYMFYTVKKAESHMYESVIDLLKAKLQRKRQELTQTTPDQPVDDEAVYYKVAGDCPKGCVYSLRSLWRKKRRYVDPDASTSQELSMVPTPLWLLLVLPFVLKVLFILTTRTVHAETAANLRLFFVRLSLTLSGGDDEESITINSQERWARAARLVRDRISEQVPYWPWTSLHSHEESLHVASMLAL